MNAPPRYESFVLEDEELLVTITDDTKIPNAATARINKQDHTLGNMIRAHLLSMPQILFAGYKVPHPLHPYFIIKLQTDGSITPTEALEKACEGLIGVLAGLEAKFKREFSFKDVELGGAGGPGMGMGAGGQGGEDAYGGTGWGGGRDYLDF